MEKKHNRLKNGILLLVTLTICYCLIETGCFLILRSITTVRSTWGHEEVLTKHFPAQFRLSKEEILQEFPDIAPLQRAGQFLSFEFDPVLGYRAPSFIRWYGGDIEDIQDKFLIACFGGSTTQLDNWPKYLIDEARKAGVKQDILVLNAGLSGYMSFTEKLYFSEWILPMLEKAGKKPDLVLTLDGVNDVWYRIMGWAEAQKNDAPQWYSRYHGYHQHHDEDMAQLRTIPGATRQLIANLASWGRKKAILFAPYTMRFMEYLVRKHLGRNSSSDSEVKYESEELPKDVQQEIVDSWKNDITDFHALVTTRDIPFVAFLQPVALPEYHPFPTPEEYPFKSIDWMGVKEHRAIGALTRLTHNKIVPTGGVYAQAEEFYGELARKYPGDFDNLIGLFRDIPDTRELYSNDMIHYNQTGKKTIARAVIHHLLNTGRLADSPKDVGTK